MKKKFSPLSIEYKDKAGSIRVVWATKNQYRHFVWYGWVQIGKYIYRNAPPKGAIWAKGIVDLIKIPSPRIEIM